MTPYVTLPVLALSLLLAAGPAQAEAPAPMTHAAQCPMMTTHTATGPFAAAMTTMHTAMSQAPVTGNVDVDFVHGMIPHHQGAIDMAKVVLGQGQDPEIRALVEGIIKAQEAEIAQMRAWLTKQPTPTPTPEAPPHAHHP